MASSGSALAVAVDQVVAEVEARTLGRFKVSWHVPDQSVSTEGFDLETWDDLCKRSRPAEVGETPSAELGHRRLHLVALRDTHIQQENMAGYAKIKLLNHNTLAPKAAADLFAALSLAEGATGAAAGSDRLGGGIGYLGCVVVRPSHSIHLVKCVDCNLVLIYSAQFLCFVRRKMNTEGAVSALFCACSVYSMHCASLGVVLLSLTRCIPQYANACRI